MQEATNTQKRKLGLDRETTDANTGTRASLVMQGCQHNNWFPFCDGDDRGGGLQRPTKGTERRGMAGTEK